MHIEDIKHDAVDMCVQRNMCQRMFIVVKETRYVFEKYNLPCLTQKETDQWFLTQATGDIFML